VVQTFLPDSRGYAASLYVLDTQRLGKQRVEGMQLLLANLGLDKEFRPRISSWRNHSAARMWHGHEYALLEYIVTSSALYRRRGIELRGQGYSDTVAWTSTYAWQYATFARYQESAANEWRLLEVVGVEADAKRLTEFLMFAPPDEVRARPPMWTDPPLWFGNEAFHRSHQSNLLRKAHTMTDKQMAFARIPRDYYDQFWPNVPDDLPYVWPVAKGEHDRSNASKVNT
jgi:hypothetical protein